MAPAPEIAPFFSPTTDPAILRSATEILRSLRALAARPENNAWSRSALGGVSALLACERHGVDLVSRQAAQRTSASSAPVFTTTLTKCRNLLATAPLKGSPLPAAAGTPSGRKSMATRSPAPTFDPLNLPGSSAKKVVRPVGKRVTRDLSELRKRPSMGKGIERSQSQSPSRSSTLVIPLPVSVSKPADADMEQPLPPTPTTPTKRLRPQPSPSQSPNTPSQSHPTPRRLATATIRTGNGSPMHNALMKNKLESASAARLAGGRRAFDEDADEDDVEDGEEDGGSPSKRRRLHSAKHPPKGIDLALTTSSHPQRTDLTTLPRATTTANQINTLFQPLPSLPIDPHVAIPPPQLVFSGPGIFSESSDREWRVMRKMVPPADVSFGDPYSLMHARDRETLELGVLGIPVGEVGEAVKKRERARKRRLGRMRHGVGTGWDREFGVPVAVGGLADGLDWEERLELYNARIPDGVQKTIEAFTTRTRSVAVDLGRKSDVDDAWIGRAQSHGIAVRVYEDK